MCRLFTVLAQAHYFDIWSWGSEFLPYRTNCIHFKVNLWEPANTWLSNFKKSVFKERLIFSLMCCLVKQEVFKILDFMLTSDQKKLFSIGIILGLQKGHWPPLFMKLSHSTVANAKTQGDNVDHINSEPVTPEYYF